MKKAITAATNEWVEKQAEDIEQSLALNNIRKAYNVVKNLTREKNARTNIILDANGNLLTNTNEVAACWKEYCCELYQHQANVDTSILDEITTEGDTDP